MGSNKEPHSNEKIITPVLTVDKDDIVIPKKNKNWLLISVISMSLLFGLTGMGAAYYLYKTLPQYVNSKLQTQQKNINQEIIKLNQNIQQSQTRPLNQISAIANEQLNLNNQITELSRLPDQLQILEKQITALAQKTPSHWKEAEADYLVKMAARKLYLENDTITAAALLKDADSRIASINNPALQPLRQALAHDINAVSAIKVIDISGAIFTIDELINHIATLPLHQPQINEEKQINNTEVTDSVMDWKQNLAHTWRAILDDFVTIRHRENDITPLLSPQQEWYLSENIQNKLLQAQLALYSKNAANYYQAIAMAQKWIKEYYNVNDPSVQSTLANLEKLANIAIGNPQITSLTALPLLEQLMHYGDLLPVKEGAEQ